MVEVLLLGAGGHAAVLAEMLADLGVGIRAVVAPSTDVHRLLVHLPVVTDEAVLAGELGDLPLVNGVGSVPGTVARRELYERYTSRGFRFLPVVSPRATVARSVLIGDGAQVMAGAVIQPGARVGPDAIVNTGALVDHDCVIGAHAHVAPGATLSGGVQVGERAHIGTGAQAVQGVVIGADAVLGAGAVAATDVPAGVTVLPAAQRATTRAGA
jgi:sugar O-acyltransferase (sialic acid O-acetyltransferase NeuD family)